MKAAEYRRFGDPGVLQVVDVADPPTRPGHARVRVHAASVNPKDVLLRKGKFRWLFRSPLPRTPGYDVAGVLMDDAPGLAAGSEVFGMIQHHSGGASAQIASLAFDELAAKPRGLSMAEAAALPLVGLTALQALRDELVVKPNQRVLINGASGGLGTMAVQVAGALGAEVIGVCSGRNAGFVRELGASRVIDYTAESAADERGLDAIFDCFGSLPWSVGKACLKDSGRYCTAIPRPESAVRGVLRRLQLHRAAMVVVRSNTADLDALRKMVEDGSVRPVVEASFPLEEIAEAHRRIESRRTRGKLVVELPLD